MLRNKCSISFREQRRVAKLGKAAVLIGGELEDLDQVVLDLQLHQCENHVDLDMMLGEYEGEGREDEHLEAVDPVADLNDDRANVVDAVAKILHLQGQRQRLAKLYEVAEGKWKEAKFRKLFR